MVCGTFVAYVARGKKERKKKKKKRDLSRGDLVDREDIRERERSARESKRCVCVCVVPEEEGGAIFGVLG